jgi:hypothetical protein
MHKKNKIKLFLSSCVTGTLMVYSTYGLEVIPPVIPTHVAGTPSNFNANQNAVENAQLDQLAQSTTNFCLNQLTLIDNRQSLYPQSLPTVAPKNFMNQQDYIKALQKLKARIDRGAKRSLMLLNRVKASPQDPQRKISINDFNQHVQRLRSRCQNKIAKLKALQQSQLIDQKKAILQTPQNNVSVMK